MHHRLKELREKKGYNTAKEAAEALGVNPHTYTQHENGTRIPGRSLLQRYAAFYGSTVDYLISGKRPPSTGRGDVIELAGPIGTAGMPVKGFVRAGIWQETYKPEGDKFLPISRDLRYPSQPQFALEVQGESMNRRFKHGEYAVCVEWRGEPKPDDIVVVQRDKNGLFEATIKVARPISPTRLELWPDSTHPDHQTPLVIEDGQQEYGETIEIIAKVIGAYRKV